MLKSAIFKEIAPLLLAAVVGIAFTVIFTGVLKDIGTAIRKLIDPEGVESDETAEVLENELDRDNTTHTRARFRSFATKLRDAVAGLGGLFTDEAAIYDVFSQMLTSDDLIALQIEYQALTGDDLYNTLRDELDASELELLKGVGLANGVNIDV